MTPAEMKALFDSMSPEEQESLIAELSDSEVESLLSQMGSVDKTNDAPFGDFVQNVKDVAMPVLGVAGKALDYAGGIARTAAAAPLLEDVGIGDVANAVMANPLSGSEILERAGMPESGKLSDVVPGLYNETGEGIALQRGGWADPTGRGAAGMALEVATDPLTYLTLGATKAVGEGIEAAGKSAYRSGLKSADRALELVGKGKQGFSDTAMKYGLSGSAEEIADQASALAKKLAQEQQDILEAASRAGATVDVEKALRPVLKDAQKIREGKNILPVRQEAAGLENIVADISDRTKAIPEQVIKPEAVQGGLFPEGELPKAVQTKRLATNADEAIAAQYGIPQQVVMPEGAMASKALPEDEMLRQALEAGASRKDISLLPEGAMLPYGTRVEGPTQMTMFGVEPPELTALKGVQTGPAQQALLSDAATVSTRTSTPNVYEEIVTQGKIAPGQTSMFAPGELVQPAKPTVIPGRSAPTVAEASQIKSQIYGQIGTPGFSTLTSDKKGQKLFKRSANRLKVGVEQAVSKVDPAMGARLKEVNNDLGMLLSSRKVVANEASKEIAKNALTSVDGLLAVMNPAAAASKKTADILKGTSARTKGGAQMQRFGQYLQNKEMNPYQFLLKESVRQQGDNNE